MIWHSRCPMFNTFTKCRKSYWEFRKTISLKYEAEAISDLEIRTILSNECLHPKTRTMTTTYVDLISRKRVCFWKFRDSSFFSSISHRPDKSCKSPRGANILLRVFNYESKSPSAQNRFVVRSDTAAAGSIGVPLLRALYTSASQTFFS